MEATVLQSQLESYTIDIPRVDLKRFKGIVKAMGWTCRKKEETCDEEWTAEQEREAFLHTSRVNAARNFAKYL